MDLPMIDQTYCQLQNESQQTIQALTALAQKLQAATHRGDPNAREWMLDLKETALGIQSEQNETSNLLQAIHGFLANQVVTSPVSGGYPVQPQYQQPQYQQAAPVAPPGGQGGGMLHRFLGGGFGRTIATGAAFGIGDDLINQLF